MLTKYIRFAVNHHTDISGTDDEYGALLRLVYKFRGGQLLVLANQVIPYFTSRALSHRKSYKSGGQIKKIK
jgi:hypothetical protein